MSAKFGAGSDACDVNPQDGASVTEFSPDGEVLNSAPESYTTPLVPQQALMGTKEAQVDIEMDGKEAPDSLAHDELKPVHLKYLTIGKDYEYQDAYGNWHPVKITEESPDGDYVGQSLFTQGQVHSKIRASQCIESAPPHKENWYSYWFWTIFDFCLAGGIVTGCVLLDRKHPEIFKSIPEWVHWAGTFLLIPVFFVARFFWFFFNRAFSKHAKAVKSVKNFICHRVAIDGKEVYFVGTMHVSPGSVADVQRVADEVDPDVYMIELDYDRLAGMKEAEIPPVRDQLLFKKDGRTVRGVHTDWNASMEKRKVAGELTFTNGSSMEGKILVTPFIKGNIGCFVHAAEKLGAVAVFFLDTEGRRTPTIGKDMAENPSRQSSSKSTYMASRTQLHSDSFFSLTQYFFKTRQNTAPNIPCYLVPDHRFSAQDEGLRVEFQVRASNVGAPHTCRSTCLAATCMTCTGIGIMYGLIRLAGCKVGGEFLVAEKLAKQRGKVLATIDMGIGRLGAALRARAIPYPSNIWYIIVAWAAAPRIFFTWLFLPQGHKLDLVLNMLYGFARFRLRTWLAFFLGVGVACGILTGLLYLVQLITETAATEISKAANSKDSEKIGQKVALGVVLAFKAFLFPVVYKGLLDSRDEQMYRGAVAQIRRRPNAKKFMIVIGAAHSNGMIRRMYERGFMPDGNEREARRNWAPFPFNRGVFFNYLYYGGKKNGFD